MKNHLDVLREIEKSARDIARHHLRKKRQTKTQSTQLEPKSTNERVTHVRVGVIAQQAVGVGARVARHSGRRQQNRLNDA